MPTVELFHPPASHRDAKKSLAGKRVGTVSGYFELSERSGGGGGGGAPSAKLVAMQTEIDAKAREIAPLTPTPTPTLTLTATPTPTPTLTPTLTFSLPLTLTIKAREIAQLRAQLGLPRGAAAKVRGDMGEIWGRYGAVC